MSNTNDETEITLDDVEIMIGVLERFVRVSRKASRVLKALAPAKGGGGQGDFMQMFMNTLIQQKMGATEGGDLEEEDMEIDEDTKQLLEKIRAKQKVEK